MEVLPVDAALPGMQALASRVWTPESRHHPGQLAWSARYADPEELDHGPVALVRHGDRVLGWAWAEAPDWLELCVDPSRSDVVAELVDWFLEQSPAGEVATMVLESEQHLLGPLVDAGFVVSERPWFTHHTLDLAGLGPQSLPEGYVLRPVEPGETDRRAAVHRAAWSATSKVTGTAYARLAATLPYRSDLDWVVEHQPSGEWVASCLAWLDPMTAVALLEPVGCVPEHRGRGLAGAVSLAALLAARDAGARSGLVCPRGDDAYPVPQRVYRALGFVPGPRTQTLIRVGG
jgi:GNAT superfamily N-acetyltransferase